MGELDAQAAQELLLQRQRLFIEERLLVQQWCEALLKHYSNLTDDVKGRLPPLPGTTAEEMLPSLFVRNPEDLDSEQYNREASVLRSYQEAANKLFLELNQESVKCLSDVTQES